MNERSQSDSASSPADTEHETGLYEQLIKDADGSLAHRLIAELSAVANSRYALASMQSDRGEARRVQAQASACTAAAHIVELVSMRIRR